MVQLLESYQNQGFYLGPEVTYAVPVAATKRILSVDAPFKMELESETFTPSGDTAPSLVVINDEWSTVDASGKPDFEAFPYFASSVWGITTPTNPSGSVYLWTFNYDGRTRLNPQSYTAIYGTIDRAAQVAGLVFTKYGMTVNRGAIDFTAMALGKVMEQGTKAFPRNEKQTVAIGGSVAPTGGTFTLTYSGQTTSAIAYNASAATVQAALEALSNIGVGEALVTGANLPAGTLTVEFAVTLGNSDITLMTGSAASLTGGTGNVITVTETQKGGTSTDIDAKALFPGYFDIYTADNWADLIAGTGTTVKQLYCYDFQVDTPERIARTKPINSTKSSDGLVETEDQEMTVKMTMGVDTTTDSIIANKLRTGQKIFVRLDAVGPVISTTYNYMVRHYMCIILNEVDAFQSSDNVLVVPLSGVLARDKVSGMACRVVVQNTLAAL